MGRSRYKIYRGEHSHFVTSSLVGFVPMFATPEAAHVMLEALRFLQTERKITLIAYVIMKDHIHAIVQGEELAAKIGRMKSYVARRVIDVCKLRGNKQRLQQFRRLKKASNKDQEYQFWQEGYHPKEIVGDDMMIQKIRYIHENPVKKGYVDKPHLWPYSSARNYHNMEGMIPVDRYTGRG